MKNATFYFIQICPRFVPSHLLILEIIIFERNYGLGKNLLRPLKFRIKKKLHTKTCQIGKPTHPSFQIYFIQLMKKDIFFDVPKFRFFRLFSNF
jgi:hypothetical protein